MPNRMYIGYSSQIFSRHSSTCSMSRPIGFTLISILVIPTIIAALIGCGDSQYRRAASELAVKLHNHSEVPASEATGQPVKARFANLQAAPNVARRIIY